MGPFPAGKGRLVRLGVGGALEEKMTCLNVIRMHVGSEIIHRHVRDKGGSSRSQEQTNS